MRKLFVVLIISVLILSTCIIPTFNIANVVKADAEGAKSDFIFRTFSDVYDAYEALKAGGIDMLAEPLPYDFFMDAVNASNLKVVGGLSGKMFLFDLNNNYTIAEYPGVKSPLYEVKFRQAIAHAIDKDYIIKAFWYSMGRRIDQPLPALFSGWMNETYFGDSYPYEYNWTRAAQLLDELGFVDTDGNGWRNYPSNWPGASNADFTQYPIKVLVRSDHTQRCNSGLYLVQQLENIGIKCYTICGPMSIIRYIVFEEKNYHIYTSGWNIWDPSALYFLYHSMHWTPNELSTNYVTGMNESNLANYPQLDKLLEEMYFASSFDVAREKLKVALGFMVENCINIPLVTSIDYYAHRIEVQGTTYVNVSAYWPNYDDVLLNKYNFLSTYKDDGSPIVVGLCHLNRLNVIDSRFPFDAKALAAFYDNLIYYAINDPTNYLPWLTSWDIGTWHDVETGQNKTKITFYLTNSSYWIKPVTGEVLGGMTAFDFEFTTWYYYQTPDSWYHYDVSGVHHIRILDDYTVEVYMDTTSIWSLLYLEYLIVPKQVWTSFQQLAWRETTIYIEGVNVTTPGYIGLPYLEIGAPVTVECIAADGYPLLRYEDYNIEVGRIKIYKDLPDGTLLNVTYYARGDPYGTFPGNLPWQDILVGNGPFYITELVDPFSPGGYIYFKANPYYNVRIFNRDLAIRNIAVSKTIASVGENITVYVEVENEGEILENFELTLYANETIIGRRNVYLSPNSSSFITFQWNTNSYSPGEYVVWAEVPILYGENDTSDNIYIDGIVTLTILVVDVAVTQITASKNVVNYGETLSINVTVENQGETAVSFAVNLYGNTSIIDQIYIVNLPSQSSIILPFTWNTNGWPPGCYILAAQADTLKWETDIEDNFLTDGIITILLPSTETFLTISPSITKVTLGNSFTVSVNIFNVVDLYGYDIIIKYNTSLLTANIIQEGPFLRSAGETVIFANMIDDEEGVIRFATSLLGVSRGVDGNGTLFTIEFTASQQYTGTSTLLFSYTALANHTIQPIACLAINGQVTIVEIDVKTITVVKNEMTYEIIATSNSTIHALSYVEEECRIDLDVSGASGTNGFCNITIPKELLTGTLVVLVNGNPVAYTKIENETHITLIFTFHNSRSIIQIIETVFGDLNGDRIVDIFDVVRVCIAYGSQPGDPNWDPVADIIQNNLIDIFDAVAVCVNYGKQWQPP